MSLISESFSSAARTLLVERRLGYRLGRFVDHSCRAFGFPEKTVVEDGFRFRVRRLTVDLDLVRHVAIERDYFPAGIALRPTDTVIDVGGNIGTFAILAASMVPRGRVIVIEPEPENLRLLRRNVVLNHARNVQVVSAALMGSEGTVTLYRTGDQGAFHSVLSDRVGGGDTLTVTAVTLPQLLAEYGIKTCDLLKLDCEGAEFDIMESLPAPIFRRIGQIAMEYHTAADPTSARQAEQMISLLRARGFQMLRHDPFPDYACGHLFAVNNASAWAL